MLKPRTDFEIHIRGGYKEGSRGRYTAKDHFSCINCGEKFSSRRHLSFHHMKCPYYKHVRQTKEYTFGERNCARCGKKFEDKRHLMFHVGRCGYYVAMQHAEADDSSDAVNIVNNGRDREKIEQATTLEESADSAHKADTGIEMKCGDGCNNGEDEIDKQETADLKISSRKRKIQALLSYKSFESLKKLKIEHNAAPLYRTLLHDIEQEHRHNIFDRVPARERSHKCFKCNAKFKYKHTFDSHMKFVHDETRLVVMPSCSEDSEEDCKAGLKEVSSGSSDSLTLMDKPIKEKPQSGSDANNNNEIKSRISNYPCEFCHLSFRYHSRRERHVKSVHKKQTGQAEFWNIFSCTHCAERFPNKSSLLEHYSCVHLRNRSSSLEKDYQEHFMKAFNANDVMQHLRRNLLCLQDGFDTERICKSKDPRSDDCFRVRNADMKGNQLTVAMRGKKSSFDSDLRESDQSEHYVIDDRRGVTARKRAFNLQYYHSSDGENSKDVYTDRITKISPNRQQVNAQNFDGNDSPLDLSVKNKVEHVTFGSSVENKTLTVSKPTTSERALLLEYYKDFLQEYCLK